MSNNLKGILRRGDGPSGGSSPQTNRTIKKVRFVGLKEDEEEEAIMESDNAASMIAFSGGEWEWEWEGKLLLHFFHLDMPGAEHLLIRLIQHYVILTLVCVFSGEGPGKTEVGRHLG